MCLALFGKPISHQWLHNPLIQDKRGMTVAMFMALWDSGLPLGSPW